MELLLSLPPERLHTLGLAVWYLASTPNRRANQCLGACLVLETVLRVLGADVRTVVCTIDVPWAGAGGIRYGSLTPHFEGDQLVGHVVLLADGVLLDPTAMQFPELRDELGQRPLVGLLGVDPVAAATAGVDATVRLGSGRAVRYTLLPAAAAADIAIHALETEDRAIKAAAQNLLTTYALALSEFPAVTIAAIRQACPRLAAAIVEARGKAITWHDGVASLTLKGAQ